MSDLGGGYLTNVWNRVTADRTTRDGCSLASMSSRLEYPSIDTYVLCKRIAQAVECGCRDVLAGLAQQLRDAPSNDPLLGHINSGRKDG